FVEIAMGKLSFENALCALGNRSFVVRYPASPEKASGVKCAADPYQREDEQSFPALPKRRTSCIPCFRQRLERGLHWNRNTLNQWRVGVKCGVGLLSGAERRDQQTAGRFFLGIGFVMLVDEVHRIFRACRGLRQCRGQRAERSADVLAFLLRDRNALVD